MPTRANWHHDELEPQSSETGSSGHDEATQKRIAAVRRRAEATRVNEAALWDRRDEVEHPAPVGYWLEEEFTFVTPLDQLLARADVLKAREEQNRRDGISCGLKGRPGMACSACPVHEIGQDSKKAPLCRMGQEQERIQALIITKQVTIDGG